VLQEVSLLGDAEGSASFAVGLSASVCPNIQTVESPALLVIDFPTR
jgi:hypothetical protein